MKICNNCNTQNNDNVPVCLTCGKPFEVAPNVNAGQQQFPTQPKPPVQPQPQMNQPNPNMPYGRMMDTTGMLVWSIINVVFSTGFGIVALIFTLLAKDAENDFQFRSKMKTAKIFNIISTVLFALTVLLIIIWCIFIFGMVGSIINYEQDYYSGIISFISMIR